MRWREIPQAARAYMLYHTLIAPQLIVRYLLLLHMLRTGYLVLDVGALGRFGNALSFLLLMSSLLAWKARRGGG